ncbi:DNA topoisomerase IV [Flavobacterium oreochromis]|uniref:DNA topoisomerase IV n=1 Tax=Flavobacterium oreochromis TaxID=2906078 RepID=UPI003858AFDA
MLKYFMILLTFTFASCYNVERNCNDFKTGTFRFNQKIEGIKHSSTFTRNDSLQIETFEGKTDTAKVRWINDCEYILQKVNPKNLEEKKAIQIKILSTNQKGYCFEYCFVGESKKQKGFVTKTK